MHEGCDVHEVEIQLDAGTYRRRLCLFIRGDVEREAKRKQYIVRFGIMRYRGIRPNLSFRENREQRILRITTENKQILLLLNVLHLLPLSL